MQKNLKLQKKSRQKGHQKISKKGTNANKWNTSGVMDI